MVEIEADVGGGLPRFQLVGLPDAALHEAKDRVRAAITNSGRTWPNERIVLALSPASLRKAGSGFDLALAVAILGAGGVVEQRALERTMLLGELALDGRLRPVRGVLPCLLAARAAGMRRAVVPEAVLAEAALVDGIEVFGAGSLAAVLRFLAGGPRAAPAGPGRRPGGPRGRRTSPTSSGSRTPGRRWRSPRPAGTTCCWSGRPAPARPCSPSGSSGCCPGSTADEALALAAIRSVAGRLPAAGPLSTVPPIEAPHHSSSMAALVGGGSGMARPGAVSLAHRGLLFLDEAPEWPAQLLDALRTPLEEGEIRLARAEGTVRYPARFQLLLAANPCPCAPAHDRDCVCPSLKRRRYLGRLSGPLLDRVDLRAHMYPAHRPVRGPTRRGEHGHRAGAGAGRPGGGGRTLGRAGLADQRRGAGAGAAHPLRAAAEHRATAGGRPALRRAHRARCRPGAAGGLDVGRPGRPDRPDQELVTTALFFRDRRAA